MNTTKEHTMTSTSDLRDALDAAALVYDGHSPDSGYGRFDAAIALAAWEANPAVVEPINSDDELALDPTPADIARGFVAAEGPWWA